MTFPPPMGQKNLSLAAVCRTLLGEPGDYYLAECAAAEYTGVQLSPSAMRRPPAEAQYYGGMVYIWLAHIS